MVESKTDALVKSLGSLVAEKEVLVSACATPGIGTATPGRRRSKMRQST